MNTSIVARSSTSVTVPNKINYIEAAETIAAEYARDELYELHELSLAPGTLEAHKIDLRTFCEFLAKALPADVPVPDAEALRTTPEAWRGIGFGLASTYRRWLLAQGYAMGTVSRKLSSMRVYAKLAAAVDDSLAEAVSGVRLVGGHNGRLAENVDDKRREAGTPTRKSTKRAAEEMRALTPAQIKALKAQCDASTPQGRRDAVLITLLVDHGLRIGEAVGLVVSGVVRIGDKVHDVGLDLDSGTLRFYREKVRLVQTLKLSSDCLVAMRRYVDAGDCPAMGYILRGSRKGGALLSSDKPMSTTAASARVTELARRADIGRLSAHDCRHTWASAISRLFPGKKDEIQQAGGWSSDAMLRRYIAPLECANESISISL